MLKQQIFFILKTVFFFIFAILNTWRFSSFWLFSDLYSCPNNVLQLYLFCYQNLTVNNTIINNINKISKDQAANSVVCTCALGL